ncbi:ABC transporter substrate-binding protein [Halalkalibacter oceani]|uniref:ABC transporter substrate-binding protein n=1 Tax=Halalkalibacter oceani TaxID=1653776 RepID=UPI00339603F5
MQQKRKLSLSIFLISSFLIGLGACGSEDTSSPNEDGEAPPVAAEDVREIIHPLGTTVIEGTPERIVTLYQGATDAANALGIVPVGAVESWEEAPVYEYLRPELENMAIVGVETQPNVEEIAKLEPDLIVASHIRHEEIYEQLSQIAPTVVNETIYDFKESLQLLADATNNEEKAEEILSAWDERVADFQTKIKEKLGDEWPINAAVLNFRADHARIYVTGFAGSILQELGFTSSEQQLALNEDIIMLNDKESIPDMNADVFYVFYYDSDPAVQQAFEEWTSHPLWDSLDAVKKDQVYIVDEVIWNLAGGVQAANLMLDDIYDRFDLEK